MCFYGFLGVLGTIHAGTSNCASAALVGSLLLGSQQSPALSEHRRLDLLIRRLRALLLRIEHEASERLLGRVRVLLLLRLLGRRGVALSRSSLSGLLDALGLLGLGLLGHSRDARVLRLLLRRELAPLSAEQLCDIGHLCARVCRLHLGTLCRGEDDVCILHTRLGGVSRRALLLSALGGRGCCGGSQLGDLGVALGELCLTLGERRLEGSNLGGRLGRLGHLEGKNRKQEGLGRMSGSAAKVGKEAKPPINFSLGGGCREKLI